MMLCGVTHPPGAATALIAVMGSRAVTDLGFLYIPLVVASALVVVAAALLVNNASGLPGRQYPSFEC
jgi:CBS domain-containing membrane protein